MKSIKYARRANADLKDMTDYTARIWGAQQEKKHKGMSLSERGTAIKKWHSP